MYIRIAFSIELRLRVSRSLRSLANDIMLANVNSDLYFLFLRPVHIAPSSLSSATVDVVN